MFCFNISMVSVLFKIGFLFKCLLDFLIFAYSIVFFFWGGGNTCPYSSKELLELNLNSFSNHLILFEVFLQ